MSVLTKKGSDGELRIHFSSIVLTALPVLFITCASPPLRSPFTTASPQVGGGWESTLEPIEGYKNIEFMAANDREHFYLKVNIAADTSRRFYANSVFTIWLDGEGRHVKDLGFQFSGNNSPHPLIKKEYDALTTWGGFREALTGELRGRLESYIKQHRSQIVYFNPATKEMEFIQGTGERGFILRRRVTKKGLEFMMEIPLNADGEEVYGLGQEPGEVIAVGFEILPRFELTNRHSREPPQPPSPGMTGTRSGYRSRSVPELEETLKPEIYWLDIKLSTGEGDIDG